MINKAILVGNVGTDPDVRHLDEDRVVAKFSFATSETIKGIESTEWHQIVIWGNLAKIVEQYVKKGHKLYLEGKIKTRSWDDSEGNKKFSTEIVCNVMLMLNKPE